MLGTVNVAFGDIVRTAKLYSIIHRYTKYWDGFKFGINLIKNKKLKHKCYPFTE